MGGATLPRPSVNPLWRQAVFYLMTEEETRSAAWISRLLNVLSRQSGLPAPSTRTISRLQMEWRQLSSEKQEQLRGLASYFRWPESMEAGLLPWEASAV